MRGTLRRVDLLAGLSSHRGARRTGQTWRKVRRESLAPPRPNQFGAFGRSFILPPARISNPQWIFIGDDVVIHEEVWLSVVHSHADVTPRLRIGDGCRVGRFCQISCVGHIEIGRDVTVSDHVQIGDTSHAYADPSRPVADQGMTRPEPVTIGPGALIGVGAVVLPGITIGAGAYISEATVVTADVPPGAVVAGNPGVRTATPHR